MRALQIISNGVIVRSFGGARLRSNMKNIKPDELFNHLGDFLKARGIEFKDGSYTHRIRKGCNLLGDAINATQKTVRTAKTEADKKLDQLRQAIHEATAPKASPPPPPAAAGASSAKQNRGAKRKAVKQNRKTRNA